MNAQADQQLLCEYADSRSEAAFAELVRRYVDFVYSAALRMVCDSHLAEDVTQGVFVALAKNAAQFTDRTVLSVWLHRTAQNIAAQTVRTDVRRRNREQEAAAMNELLSAGSDASWEHIAPHLDEALGKLDETDRTAIFLRYFQKKSLSEVGQFLGTSDDAAQKRVSRAVERLREFFAKRGVTVGTSGLVVVISANAVQAAPVGLALTISTAAALTGTTLATAATATQAIAMTTLQKTLVTATVAILAGAGIYEARQAAQLREQNQILVVERDQAISERDDALSALARGKADLAQQQQDKADLLRLRREVGMLRTQTNELAKLQKRADQPPLTKTPATTLRTEPGDSSGVYVPREQYAFVGYAEPESTLKSLLWSMSQGDVKTALASASPAAQEQLKSYWAGKTEAEISAGLLNDNDNKLVTGYRITNKEIISANEMVLTVYQEGRNKEKKMRLERIDNEWKYAGPPRQ